MAIATVNPATGEVVKTFEPLSAEERAWHLSGVATTKNRQRLGYRRIVTLLVYLVIIPTVLLLSVGVLVGGVPVLEAAPLAFSSTSACALYSRTFFVVSGSPFGDACS